MFFGILLGSIDLKSLANGLGTPEGAVFPFYRPPNVLARRGELSARRLAPGGRWDERSLK